MQNNNNGKYIEWKTMLKSTVYRFYSMLVTMIVSYVLTGNWLIAASIGLADSAVKIITYYGFETLWNKLFSKKMKPGVVFFTGLSGSGKTTIGKALRENLIKSGQKVIMLDGDEIRQFFPNTGFDEESRKRHNRNVGFMASFFEKQGMVCIVTLIAPYRDVRDEIRKVCNNFCEIHISTSLEDCESRDPKGLYKKVRAGEIKDFTGIHDSAPYEKPLNPELTINTADVDLNSSVKQITNFLWRK
jgi:adenylylsulfate kinase